MPKVTKVLYGRKFSSENENPEARATKYEPEDISVEVQPLGDDTVDDMFRHAYQTVYKLHRDAEKLKEENIERAAIKNRIAVLKRAIAKYSPNSDYEKMKEEIAQLQEKIGETDE